VAGRTEHRSQPGSKPSTLGASYLTNFIMKGMVLSLLLLFSLTRTISGQNINLVIQVNEKLAISEVSHSYLVVGQDSNSVKMPVNYVPGELTLTTEIWNAINSDKSKKISLYFDYTTYSKDKQNVANFYTDLTRQQLQQPYLILNIYDFRNRRYKHWYQWHTDKDFLAELTFPGSGMYVRQK